MQIVQRDVRRRRVLTDESISAAIREDDAPLRTLRIDRPVGAAARRYGDTALMDGQPRIIDLAPKKISTLLLLFLGGVLLIAGLEALYYWMPALAKNATDGRIAAFDLDDEGSLAVWFSSTLLTAAGLGSLLIYFVRRHRLDDYHGNYRLWIWGALCWFGMSLDETASLHEGFKEFMSQVTGYRIYGDGSIWWVGGYALVLGVVGVRLLLEMRRNKSSAAIFLLAGGCFIAAVVAQLDWLLPESGARGVMIEEGCEMLGDLLLLIAMLAHARHVIQDAGGKLAEPTAKPKRKRKPAAASEAKSATPAGKAETTVSSKPGVPPKPSAPAKPATAPAVAAPAKRPEPARPVEVKKPAPAPAAAAGNTNRRIDPPQPESQAKLSKAERKALRRQQQEDRADRYR